LTQSGPKGIPTARAAIAGLSALLVVSLVLGASFNGADHTTRDPQRETHRDLASARQFTASLAKAVRQLVGGDTYKPALHSRGPSDLGDDIASPAMRRPEQAIAQAAQLVRVERLALPPPSATV
jgi:hypothetical protein